MTTFLRLLESSDKEKDFTELSIAFRTGRDDQRIYIADTNGLRDFPGAAFAYWVGDAVRSIFRSHDAFESSRTGLVARRGVNSNDDFRFLRLWTEVAPGSRRWFLHLKGGEYKQFYSDVYMALDWYIDGEYLQ